jgi:hypothetical protein
MSQIEINHPHNEYRRFQALSFKVRCHQYAAMTVSKELPPPVSDRICHHVAQNWGQRVGDLRFRTEKDMRESTRGI